MVDFVVKDSGERQQFASGMVRDVTTGKIDYRRVLEGPMFDRWAAHLDKGAAKYPDVAPGVANWTLAEGAAELERFKASALRHLVQWLRGDVDEDHAAAVFFNINGAEYVRARITQNNVTADPLGARSRVEHGRGLVESSGDYGQYVPALKMGR